MTDQKDVWVYLETNDGVVENVGYEMLGKARDLADILGSSVTGVLVGNGPGLSGLAEAAVARGADQVVQVEHELLDTYRPETYTSVVEAAVRDGGPGVLLIGATHNGIDLAGRLAVKLDAGLTADVTRLEIDERGELVGGVPAFAGGILALVKATGNPPQMSTVRPGVFDACEPDAAREGSVTIIEPEVSADDIVTGVLERRTSATVDLPSADVIVAAGRGFGGDIQLAHELADRLGATVGVTRPLCDEGIVSRDHQIGTTGYSLKADLCIVVGVSGAVHFTAGIEDCGTVIAVNTDADEPVFDHADYCVEGDLFEVLPALLEALDRVEVRQ